MTNDTWKGLEALGHICVLEAMDELLVILYSNVDFFKSMMDISNDTNYWNQMNNKLITTNEIMNIIYNKYPELRIERD